MASVKFKCRFTLKVHSLKLTKDQNYHEKKAARWYIVTSVFLQPLKQRLIDVTLLRLSKSLYSRSVLIKRTNHFGSAFTRRLDRRIYDKTFRHMSAFPFPFSICRITSNLPSTLKAFLLFVTVAMLSRYQSPVDCRSTNFTQKVNYHYYCHFRPGTCVATWTHKGLAISWTKKW
jgi:hypothetical protein